MIERPDITFVVPNAPQALIVPNAVQTLGVAQLAAWAERRGIRARIVDAYLEDLTPDETAARVMQRIPSRALCFFVPAESTLAHAMRVVVRVCPSCPGLPVVMGGPFATMASRTILTTFRAVDAIVRGEADEAFFEWLDAADDRSRWARIPNVAFVKEDGTYVEVPLRPPRPTLDDVPFPDRDQTIDALRARGGRPSIVASRGCYAPCTYCVVQAFWGLAGGPKWRGYGPVRTVDEIEHVLDRYGDRRVSFMDDNFFGPGDEGGRRVLAIAEEIRRRGIDVEFSVFARSDNVVDHFDTMKTLVASGLRRVFIGMEAGAPRTLQIYKKLASPEQNFAALARIRELGITAFLGAVFLHPSATLDEVDENLDFWDRVLTENPNVSTVVFGMIDVLHGTPLQRQLEREGRLTGRVLVGQQAVYEDPAVSCVGLAWERAKELYLYPSYIDAVRGKTEADRKLYDALFCRVQVELLREVVRRARAGERDLDAIAHAVGAHPSAAALRPQCAATATSEEIEGCQNIACL